MTRPAVVQNAFLLYAEPS